MNKNKILQEIKALSLSEEKIRIHHSLLELAKTFFASKVNKNGNGNSRKNYNHKLSPFRALTLPGISWIFERDLLLTFPNISITALEKNLDVYKYASLNIPPVPERISYLLTTDKEFFSNRENIKSFHIIWLDYMSPFNIEILSTIHRIAMAWVRGRSILAFTFVTAFDSSVYPLYQKVKPFSESPDRAYILPKIIKDLFAYHSFIPSVKLIKLYKNHKRAMPMIFIALTLEPDATPNVKQPHKKPVWWDTYLELRCLCNCKQKRFKTRQHSTQHSAVQNTAQNIYHDQNIQNDQVQSNQDIQSIQTKMEQIEKPDLESLPEDIKKTIQAFYQTLDNSSLLLKEFQRRAYKANVTKLLKSRKYDKIQTYILKTLTKLNYLKDCTNHTDKSTSLNP